MDLFIVCTRPGLIRGGMRHPKSKAHQLTDFTPDQLAEMLAEPELTLVLGRQLTAEDLATMTAADAAKPAKKAGK